MRKAIKIAVTGPESTGKTTIAEYLAEKTGGVAVPEFAREYLDKINRPYVYDDILHIAQEQMRNEDIAAEKNGIVFCDTELLVIFFCFDDKFGQCHKWILDELKNRSYNLVLLCNIDIPWEPDPQREDPHRREYLFDLYRKQIGLYYNNVVEITGDGSSRLNNAFEIVTEFLKRNC